MRGGLNDTTTGLEDGSGLSQQTGLGGTHGLNN